jgi:RecB family exonuclease
MHVPYPRRTEFMEARRAQAKAYLLMEGRFAGATATGTASASVLMAIDRFEDEAFVVIWT